MYLASMITWNREPETCVCIYVLKTRCTTRPLIIWTWLHGQLTYKNQLFLSQSLCTSLFFLSSSRSIGCIFVTFQDACLNIVHQADVSTPGTAKTKKKFSTMNFCFLSAPCPVILLVFRECHICLQYGIINIAPGFWSCSWVYQLLAPLFLTPLLPPFKLLLPSLYF